MRFPLENGALLGASALLAGACFLPELDLEGRPCPCAAGYTCDEATQTCHGDASTNSGAAGAALGGGGVGPNGGGGAGPTGGAPQGGGGQGGAGGDGGQGGVVEPATPLVMLGGLANGITLSVAGSFVIDADAETRWQFGRWFDAAVDPAEDLAGESPATYSSYLLDTMQTQDAVHGWTSSDDGPVVDVQIIDQTPVRVGLSSSTDYLLDDLRAATTYWVYANGRMGITTAMLNINASQPLDLLDSEYHYTTVSPNVVWSASSVDSNHSAIFVRTDGPEPLSTLQVVNFGSETPVQGDYPNENRYWQSGPQTLMANGSVTRTGALLLSPGGLDIGALDQRSKDLRAPGLEIVSGADPVDTGFDTGMAAYVVSANASVVELGVTSDRRRFSPAFVVRNWNEPVWSISLDGQTLVTDSQSAGPDALVFHDLMAGELVFLYLGDVDLGAPAAARIFTLEAG